MTILDVRQKLKYADDLRYCAEQLCCEKRVDGKMHAICICGASSDRFRGADHPVEHRPGCIRQVLESFAVSIEDAVMAAIPDEAAR